MAAQDSSHQRRTPTPQSDVLYGALPEGALLGVVHFPKATTDFRSQTIKAGFYTLRYGLIPQDGNHMGVNPYSRRLRDGACLRRPGTLTRPCPSKTW